jgi:hypothetical protein
MRGLVSIGICAVLVTLSGCLFPQGRHVVSGQACSGESIAFLDASGVTRQETLATLGPPSWEVRDSRVMAYSWVSVRRWVFSPPESWAKAGIRESHPETGEQHWALLIAYDETGIVRAHTLRQIGKASLQDACTNWSRNLAETR